MSKPKILVVDDEPKNRKLLEASLMPHGYDILTAAGGAQALNILDTEKPDLIILDINMPEMSGITFFERISDKRGVPLFPVLVLTARDNVEELFKSFLVDGFMTKPFEIKHLLTEIGIILAKRIGKKIERTSEPQRSKMALIVDDDQFVLDRCAMAFIEKGMTVGVTRSAVSALQRAYMDRPDIILVDLRLPDMSGDEFITKLKQMPKTADIPLILYTSQGSDLGAAVANQLCRKAGSQGIIGTNDPQTLLEHAKSILNINY